jgi:hypothetical protein
MPIHHGTPSFKEALSLRDKLNSRLLSIFHAKNASDLPQPITSQRVANLEQKSTIVNTAKETSSI